MDAPDAALVTITLSTATGLGLAVVLVRLLRPVLPPPEIESDVAIRFAEGERDRMQAIAKGAAASAGGFLAAVLTAVIEGKVADQLTPVTLVFVVLGSVGMLLLASAQSQASARYMTRAISSRSASSETVRVPPSGGKA